MARNSQRGSALLVALFVLVVAASIGAALSRTLATGSQGETLEISHARARFAARAGLEWAKYWVARKQACYDGSLPLTEGALAGFSVEVTCTQTDHPYGASSSSVFALAAFAQFASFGSPDYVSLRMTETVVQ